MKINNMPKIIPHLWFENQAEEAAKFYTSIFENSNILHISKYGEATEEVSGMPKGSVMTVTFELAGQMFMALNGGPVFKFNESISFLVNCENQEEIDDLWDKLTEDADSSAQMCGWLKDKYGLSWQIVPAELEQLMLSEDEAKKERAMNAILQMKKLDINVIKRAFEGN